MQRVLNEVQTDCLSQKDTDLRAGSRQAGNRFRSCRAAVLSRDRPSREALNAIKSLSACHHQDAINSLSVQQVHVCIEAVQRMKAPQVKTIFWTMLSKAEGRLLIVV